jgi:histidine triad (HIT) family protein
LASQHDDCLFCRIVREGPHLAAVPGFVAIEDIDPQAPVHLLIIPERHLESFREIGALTPAESKQMLEFLAETASSNGLEDYRVVANVGRSAGQTVFHLHWHLLGERTGAAQGPAAAAA